MSVSARQAVLVVEDDALMRMHIVHRLENAGFAALEAADADAAIRILELREDIRVVFTDIDMPGSMDGLKLAAAVRDRWPPIAIIVTSGNHDVKEEHLPKGGRFIGKPYQGQQIVQTISELLTS